MTKLVALLFLFAPLAFASIKAATIPGFNPGQYELTEGDMRLCGNGKFYVSDEGDRIWLGAYYSFKTSAGSVHADGGLADEKDCAYQLQTKIDPRGQQTTLTTVSTLTCHEGKRRIVTNEAVVTEQSITLNQTIWIDPHFKGDALSLPHRCSWKRRPSAAVGAHD